MQLDPALYVHPLDGMDMSEPEKRSFLEQLWRIAHYFADQGFGLTPEQILLGTTGTKVTRSRPAALDSGYQLHSTFNDVAFGYAGRKSDS